MSAPEGMEFNKSYPMPKSWLDPKDKDYDASEGLEEMLDKEQELTNQDMPEEKLEEENLLDLQQEASEGKALAKGLDTFIEVLEEEEQEKESLPANENTTAEHELYHGNPQNNKALSANDKRRRVVKRKRSGTRRPHNPNPYKG